MTYKADLSPERKLDLVLQYVVNLGYSDFLDRDGIAANIDGVAYIKEISEILIKLTVDGYITTSSQMGLGTYISSFDGRLFIDNGGYVKAKEIQQANIRVSSLILTQERTYRLRLLWATWSAGIAAFLLLSWNVFLWINPVYKDFPYILFGIIRNK